MDFYRNSVDVAEGGGAARPSMLQLIHGDKAIPEEIDIEGFKVCAASIADSTSYLFIEIRLRDVPQVQDEEPNKPFD